MLYITCECVIRSQDYNQEDMLKKLGKYKKAALLTDQEYLNLVELITDYPPKAEVVVE